MGHRFGLESSFSWSASTTCDDLTDAALDAANSWVEYLENTGKCTRVADASCWSGVNSERGRALGIHLTACTLHTPLFWKTTTCTDTRGSLGWPRPKTEHPIVPLVFRAFVCRWCIGGWRLPPPKSIAKRCGSKIHRARCNRGEELIPKLLRGQ